MDTKDKIQAKYLTLHNALGNQRDATDKVAFDIAHRKVWTDCDIELKARKEGLKVKAPLSKVEESELAELKGMFPEPSPPARDLAKEIDDLKKKLKKAGIT